MNHEITIGNVTLKSNALLAPMAGVSDIGFRYLARKYGAGLTYTEMISVKALCFRNKKTFDLLKLAPNETPSAVQLFGSDPEAFYNACRLDELKGFDIIDINMGCPVRKVVSRGEGSGLMKNIPLAREIVQACIEGSKRTVTVKHRKGFDSETAAEFAHEMEKAGARAITIHGRTREQMYTGESDRECIKRVVDAVSVPVFGNGDILTKEDAYSMIEETGVNGVMIARGAVGNPSIFAEFNGITPEVSIARDVEEHISYLSTVVEEHAVVGLMKAHMMGYAKGRNGARELRVRIGTAKTIKEMLELAKIIDCLVL